jgi:hypothetical protein
LFFSKANNELIQRRSGKEEEGISKEEEKRINISHTSASNEKSYLGQMLLKNAQNKLLHILVAKKNTLES